MSGVFVQPKWVIFDATDTLLRPEPHVISVYHQVAQRYGVRLTTQEIADRFGEAMQEHFAEEVSSEELEYHRWRELVFDVLGTSDRSLFDAIWKHFAEPTSWRLYEDVCKTWNWLEQNGYRLAIASNFDQRLHYIVRSLPPIHRAEQVFISSQLGFRKPSGLFFRAIERELNEQPDQLMLLGDNRQADFEGARRAGWQTLHVDRLNQFDDADTIHRLTSLTKHLLAQR